MIEVLAELTASAQFGQVDLGRADHSHVEVDLFITAYTTEATVLQKAQQLHLQARAHFPNAIEKQRTARRQLQQPELAFGPRPFECAGAITKQLGLGHRLRQSGAVERHQRRLPARAGQVTGARQQLLAGTGFTFDQQRRIQGRHAPCLTDHRRHDPGALENAVEATQFLLAHVVDTLADPVRPMQGQHRAGHGFAVVMLRLQGGDIGQEHVALDLDPQAIDPRLVGAHQFRQIEVLGVTRQGNARHFVDPHTEQLRRRAVGRDNRTAHVDRQHRKLQGAEQGIELHVPTLAGHQPYALDAEHPGDRLEFRAQGLELKVDQVRAMQVDGVAMLTADLAASDVDPVLHQQVEDVTQNADAVLAMDFDTHIKARTRKNTACGVDFSADARSLSSRLCDRCTAFQTMKSQQLRDTGQSVTKSLRISGFFPTFTPHTLLQGRVLRVITRSISTS
ncbi:hypothetical protein D3C85_848940 [compost metagenome]